ncbi:shikimate dehydrogenase [Variovorax sp. VNK109]|uniref:shikimate dehydrogenase n=1 Tax=Variovorax sp. VNK109 TaxID=3400919 RepID=UPI003C09D3C8
MTGDKLLVGLIGAGIQRSLSPAMHEEEARHHGLRLHYQLIDLDASPGRPPELPALLSALQAIGFGGVNVTFPCKQAIVPLLDDLSPDARAMGAVNTVVMHEGRMVGHNTDGSGWAWGFRRSLPNANLCCVVLQGAGGAGSAIAHALLRMGTRELRIADQLPERSRALADALQRLHPAASILATDRIEAALDGASGLVHATPTGMVKLPGLPVPSALLRPPLWVAEVVYFPLETELLRVARALGCEVVDGGKMAVGQAVGAFELFTGRKPDAARMEAHFHAMIASRGTA